MASPALIALDWGTTSLRAYALGADGAVLDRRAEPWGVMNLPGLDFGAAFDELTRAWRTPGRPPVKAVASGMVGSAQGWVRAPYVPCPAGVEQLAAALTPVPGRELWVVPGLSARDAGEAPDVMRGEETEIAGALARHPELLLAADSLLILPGTHSKWVRVAGGQVRDFTTYMTGELYAVLRDHSILGRPAKDAAPRPPDPAAAEEAFARGVRAARDAGARGASSLLFSARTLVLAGRLAPEASLDYLSGLLIGEELRVGETGGGGGGGRRRPSALIGDAALCRRYAAALRLLEVAEPPVLEGMAPAGLWSIARRAGLLPSSAPAGAATTPGGGGA